MDPIWNIEIAFTIFLQGLGNWLALPMQALTFLGQEDFYMLILPVLYWCINPAMGIRVGAILMLSGSINGYLKTAFHGARPYWLSQQIKPYIFETSFGMPSGHAQNAMSVWGVIGAGLKPTWAKVLTGIVIFGIGLSRIYLGVHFTTDVLAGWMIGGLLLWAFMKLEKPILNWVKPMRLSGQILVSFISALLLIAVNAVALAIFGGWTIPEIWIQNASLANPEELIAPYSPTGILTNAGTWFGLFTGLAWLASRGTYSARGTITQRILRYIVGVVGVAVFYFGLGQIFPRNPDLISYALRFIRYTLVGLWVSGLAPMVFIRLGLAQKLGTPSRPEVETIPVQVPAQIP